jgi:hypothetical protein
VGASSSSVTSTISRRCGRNVLCLLGAGVWSSEDPASEPDEVGAVGPRPFPDDGAGRQGTEALAALDAGRSRRNSQYVIESPRRARKPLVKDSGEMRSLRTGLRQIRPSGVGLQGQERAAPKMFPEQHQKFAQDLVVAILKRVGKPCPARTSNVCRFAM